MCANSTRCSVATTMTSFPSDQRPAGRKPICATARPLRSGVGADRVDVAVFASRRAAHRAVKASQQFIARLEAAGGTESKIRRCCGFVTRLTAAAAVILLAATLQWSFHRMNTTSPAQPIATPLALAPDEQMVIDPDSNVPSPGGDVSSAIETQFDVLPPVLSGDRQ